LICLKLAPSHSPGESLGEQDRLGVGAFGCMSELWSQANGPLYGAILTTGFDSQGAPLVDLARNLPLAMQRGSLS
jgi:hypothetical protein